MLRGQSREIDEIARYGGEEFVVGLPATSTRGAVEVAERLRAGIADARTEGAEGRSPISVTASFGVAMRVDGQTHIEPLDDSGTAQGFRGKRRR